MRANRDRVTASDEWTINGSEIGEGKHTLSAVATDNAYNVGEENSSITVHHAHPVSVGPGSVNPLSGEFSLESTDASVGTGGSPLTVSRNYGSRHLTTGAYGALGAPWTLEVGGEETLAKLANGNVVLTAGSGQSTTFVSAGSGKFTAPIGDEGVALTETTTHGFTLKEATGDITTFTNVGGAYYPTISEGPKGATDVDTYSFKDEEGMVVPKLVLEPHPASVLCPLKELEKEEVAIGCRVLKFEYDGKTTATGLNPSQWVNTKDV